MIILMYIHSCSLFIIYIDVSPVYEGWTVFDATEYIKEARFAADGIHLAPESGHRVCDAISEALSSHGASPGGSASADEDEGGDGIVNSCFYVCIYI